MTVHRLMCHTLATTSHRIHLALFLRRLMTILMMTFIYLLYVAVRLLNNVECKFTAIAIVLDNVLWR